MYSFSLAFCFKKDVSVELFLFTHKPANEDSDIGTAEDHENVLSVTRYSTVSWSAFSSALLTWGPSTHFSP